MPRFRPRISLLSALLVITIVGMAIVIAQLWREVGPLRVEVRRLRDEVGELSIEDDTRIHAIAVRTDDDLHWKWRVWVPDGVTVNVRYQFGEVPKAGVPIGQGGMSLESGEHWVELRANRDRSKENWLATLSSSSGSVSTSIGPDDHWFDWSATASTGEGVGTTTTVMDDDSAVLVLGRRRVAPVNSSAEVEKMTNPTAGFIIWLDSQYNGASTAWASSRPSTAESQ